MYHDYISYSRQHRRQQTHEISVSEFPERGQTFEYDGFEDLLKCGQLKDREKELLRKIYKIGYTSAEIARQENISRQSVNQMKTRALQKLKKRL